MMLRRERQLLVELLIEGAELRHDPQHDDRYDGERQDHQDGRIDQRRDRLALHRGDDLHVRHVAANDLLEIAALLARQQRRRVDTGKERAVRLERLRQRAPRPHPLVDIVQHRLEQRVRDPAAQNVQRLDERHARLEQRRELLIEDEEFPGGHPRTSRQPKTADGRPPGPLNAEDVEPLFLELPPEQRLGIGGVDALDDLAAGGAQPAAELHPTTLRLPAGGRKLLSLLTLSAYGNPRIIYHPLFARAAATGRRHRGSGATTNGGRENRSSD